MIFMIRMKPSNAVAMFRRRGITNSLESLENLMRNCKVQSVFVGDSLEYVGLTDQRGKCWIIMRDGDEFQTIGDLEDVEDDTIAVREPEAFIEKFYIPFT